jgi:hypothetical protein
MQEYVKRAEERRVRVERARASWELFHLRRLKKDTDDGSGASSRVRASLGALASVDKRYRKDVQVGGTTINNNTLVLADPRPPGSIGNPERYALPQADAVVRQTDPAPVEPAADPVPPPANPMKPGPIL